MMKTWMKRAFSLALALCLPVLPALAKEKPEDLTGRPIADGNVCAVHFADVTAPFSGTLRSFELTAGDTVAAGDVLMEYVTTDLYATENGTVKAVFASLGDDAEAVTRRYGGVIGIEPSFAQIIDASTAGAGSDEECKKIHLGETLYFKSAKSGRTEGRGRVIAVSGSTYRVEIVSGSFAMNETMSLYRDDRYEAKTCVGKGVVGRKDDLLVAAQGRVASVEVRLGDTVFAGQKLMSVLSPDAAPDASAQVAAPVAGIVSAVAVQPGQQVWKGALLCRIQDPAELEVVADVDEMDLGGLRVGDTLPVTLDTDKTDVLTGTVTEISALGTVKLNASYYTVHVSIPAGSARLGASASVYLPEKE